MPKQTLGQGFLVNDNVNASHIFCQKNNTLKIWSRIGKVKHFDGGRHDFS